MCVSGPEPSPRVPQSPSASQGPCHTRVQSYHAITYKDMIPQGAGLRPLLPKLATCIEACFYPVFVTC